jgi:hypothetical protein
MTFAKNERIAPHLRNTRGETLRLRAHFAWRAIVEWFRLRRNRCPRCARPLAYYEVQNGVDFLTGRRRVGRRCERQCTFIVDGERKGDLSADT